MKYIVSILLFALLTVSVQAADLTWSITTSAGTTSNTWTVSDANMDRFIAWVCAAYTLIDDGGTPADPSDDTEIPCDTNGQKAQHVQAWIAGQKAGTKNNVLRWERNVAADAAADGVSGIPD